MSINISNESKNNLSITNASRETDNLTWDDMTGTWDDQSGTWDHPKITVTREQKNNLTISNESKN